MLSVPATLDFPRQSQPRYPAVVVMHSAEGLGPAESGAALHLNAAGYATLLVNSYQPRPHLMPMAIQGGKFAPPAFIIPQYGDAVRALLHLSEHPRIDPARIAIIGFSVGGQVSILAAAAQLPAAFLGNRTGTAAPRFAAHVAFYPSLHAALVPPRGKIASPMLILLGGKDNFQHPERVTNWVGHLRAREAAGMITLKTYPDAYHGWAAGRPYGRADWVGSAGRCPTLLLGGDRVDLLTAQGVTVAWTPETDKELYETCPIRGAEVAGDAGVTSQSFADMVLFLGNALR